MCHVPLGKQNTRNMWIMLDNFWSLSPFPYILLITKKIRGSSIRKRIEPKCECMFSYLRSIHIFLGKIERVLLN